MILTVFESIGEWFQKVGDHVKDFFLEYGGNPFLWVGIILVGILIFELTYQALNRNKG